MDLQRDSPSHRIQRKQPQEPSPSVTIAPHFSSVRANVAAYNRSVMRSAVNEDTPDVER
jgi:hypothetical protein